VEAKLPLVGGFTEYLGQTLEQLEEAILVLTQMYTRTRNYALE
jgi:hypothetical protein